MEKFLYPSYMRIVVPSTLATGETLQDGETTSMTADHLRKSMRWMKRAKFTPFVTIENDKSGQWNPTTAIQVMKIAERYSLFDAAWQLGKGCEDQSPYEYLRTLKTYKLMMTVFNAGNRDGWQLVSGDPDKCLSTNYTEDFFKSNILLASFDSCHENGSANSLEESRNGGLKSYLKDNHIQLWKDVEIDGTNENEKATSWLKALGEAAQNGYTAVFKKMEENDLKIPTLSYYVSLLHKKLVGAGVLDVSPNMDSSNVSLFGHCAKFPSGPVPGAVTLFGVNSGDNPENVNIKLSNVNPGEIIQFILQENDKGDVIINGKEKLDEEYLEPIVKESNLLDSLDVSIPPKSVGFWVVTNTNVEACSFGKGSLETEENKEMYIFKPSNRFKRSVFQNEESEFTDWEKNADENIKEVGEGVFIRKLPKIEDFHSEEMSKESDKLRRSSQNENEEEVRDKGVEFPFFDVFSEPEFIDPASSLIEVDTPEDQERFENNMKDNNIPPVDEETKQRSAVNNFMEPSNSSKSIDFEPVNKVTGTIDIDKHFVDIPQEKGLTDLEAVEVKEDSTRSSLDISQMEELVGLIGQLSELMELQEDFLSIENSILQPISTTVKVANLVRSGVDTIKRIPRLAIHGENIDQTFDGLIVYKKISIPQTGELTLDEVKEMFFGKELQNTPLPVSIVQDTNKNQALLSIDLNTPEPKMSQENTEVEEETKEPREEITTEEPIVLPLINDLPKMDLPKLPVLNISDQLPVLNSLVERAKKLLAKVNPEQKDGLAQDTVVQESRMADEVVGSPLLRVHLPGDLIAKASLEKTRLKMREMRLKVQARLAQIKAQTALNTNLHNHILLKRSVDFDDSFDKATIKMTHKKATLTDLPKYKWKKFFDSLSGQSQKEIISGICYRFKDLSKRDEIDEKSFKPSGNANLLRAKRFIPSDDEINEKINEVSGMDDREHSDYFNDINHTKESKKVGNTSEKNINHTTNEFDSKSSNDVSNHIDVSDKSQMGVVKFITPKNSIEKRKSLILDPSDNCLDSLLKLKTEAKNENLIQPDKHSTDSVLDTVLEKVTSFFQGLYDSMKNLYNKST